MPAPPSRRRFLVSLADPVAARGDLSQRLRRAIAGEARFDAFSRGRFASIASGRRVEPVGVVLPRTEADLDATIAIAREAGVPIALRGAGISRHGVAGGPGLVVDCSRWLHGIVSLDPVARRAVVQPGLAVDALNAALRPFGLWFPIDAPDGGAATIGGLAGCDAVGRRALAHGRTVHRIVGVDAILADGTRQFLGEFERGDGRPGEMRLDGQRARELVTRLYEAGNGAREALGAAWPGAEGLPGLYRLDVFETARSLAPRPYWTDLGVPGSLNFGHLLVGSEGTLAVSRRLHLQLAPLPAAGTRVLFALSGTADVLPALAAIGSLRPAAIELFDRAFVAQALGHADDGMAVRDLLAQVPGWPGGTETGLLVMAGFEAGGDPAEAAATVRRLAQQVAGLVARSGLVVDAADAPALRAAWRLRDAGMRRLRAMAADGAAIRLLEPETVAVERLAARIDALQAAAARAGGRAGWCAHASAGLLHLQPFAADATRDGDPEPGAPPVDPALVQASARIKQAFDPGGLLPAGRFAMPAGPAADDPAQGDRPRPVPLRLVPDPGLRWDDTGGLAGAAARCDGHGECRRSVGGVQCPSWRVTHDERDLTRGRATSLRQALAGQLGDDAFASDAMARTLDLCVSCKACRSECPNGVDVARMKIEFRRQRAARVGLSRRDRLIAWLPRWAPWASRFAFVANLRDRLPGLPALTERWLGLSARRRLPRWSARSFGAGVRRVDLLASAGVHAADPQAGTVVLWVDTFGDRFDPELLADARRVLEAAGQRVYVSVPARGERPLCCGRTFLAAGLVDEARAEAARTLRALAPLIDAGVPVVGLEPSCLLTMRDEFLVHRWELEPDGERLRALAQRMPAQALLLEEWLVGERRAGRLVLPLRPLPQARALVHGHCHQKAFGAFDAVGEVLGWIPGLAVEPIDAGCCGLAGAFGYEAEHHDIAMAIGETALLPAVRAAGDDVLLVADGTSCRRQVADGTGRRALHVAQVLARALDD